MIDKILFVCVASLLFVPAAKADKIEASGGQVQEVAIVPAGILAELEAQTEYHDQSESGYEDTGHRTQGILASGAESWQRLTLGEGTYRVVGTCSNSCMDVNLQLWLNDVNVYEDMLDDDYPYLDFAVDELSEYRVKAIMASCDGGGEGCGYQLSVWSQAEVEERTMAEQLSAQTASHTESMNENGWHLMKGLESVGDAEINETREVSLTLPEAGEYRVMAVCSDECGNVDLEIQESGERLGSDTFQDDYPFVTFTTQDVNVTASVTMVQCASSIMDSPGCGYELSVWRR